MPQVVHDLGLFFISVTFIRKNFIVRYFKNVLFLYYINQEITYHDFWDSVIDTLRKDNEDYIKLLKKELDEEEFN